MGVIHRDVAARNFLIVKDARDYKVKISDFGNIFPNVSDCLGSSRRTETYSPKSDFMIPVKWRQVKTIFILNLNLVLLRFSDNNLKLLNRMSGISFLVLF